MYAKLNSSEGEIKVTRDLCSVLQSIAASTPSHQYSVEYMGKPQLAVSSVSE